MRHLLLLLLAGSVFATGEFEWVEDGVPVRQGVHIEWQRSGDVGAPGEMIFGWSDTRTGDRDIYVQKIDTSGNKLWGDTGIRATVAAGRQEDPVLVSDGSGGAYLAWIDYRDDEYGDVYAQHIDSNGNLSWDASGVPLAVNAGSQQSANMARGATGVAYVIWNDGSQSESGDIFGTVLTTAGPLASGGTNGLPVVNASGTQTNHSIETSGSEVVVVWRDTRDTNDPDIYGQRLDVNFTGLWGENGLMVCGNASDQVYPKVAPADGDRVAVSWLDNRNNIKTDIFSQLLDVNGNPVWAVDGIPLTNLASEQSFSRVKSNGVDRIYYVWQDFRNNAQDPDIFIQSLDFSGTPVWTDGGIPVVTADLKQLQPRFTLGDAGGVYITWLDERNGGYPQSDIYIQYVNVDGSMAFVADGLALTSGKKYQNGGLVRPDGNGGALVVWSNASTGSIGVTGQHVGVDGSQAWEVDGSEFFFGIDGDASKFQTLTWDDNDALIFWEDNRWAGTGSVSMAQVMDQTGAIQYAMDGEVLSGNEQQLSPIIVPDNEGGAYITYTNISTGTEILFAQHVGDDLAPTWASDGIQVNPNAILGQFKPQMVTSADAYLYYFWTEDIFFQGLLLHAQKYDINGVAQWAAGGLQIGPPEIGGDKYVTSAIAMADSTVIYVWESETVDGTKTYVSKLSPAGSNIWTEAVTEAAGTQRSSVAAYNPESDLLIIAWEDLRNVSESSVDLYAVSVDTDGNLGAEQLISNQFGDQTNLALSFADDNSSTLYAAWQDYDGFQHDIYVKNLTTDTAAEQITTLPTENKAPALRTISGSRYLVAWEDVRNGIHSDLYFYDSHPDSRGHGVEGVPLCLAILNQMQPQIVSFAGSNPDSLSYLIVWQDMRSSGKTELTNIYAQAYSGQMPVSVDEVVVAQEFKVGSAYPNPFNGAVSIPIENMGTANLDLYIYDLKGREILHESLGHHVGHSYTWSGQNRFGHDLSSGVYMVSIVSETQLHTQKVMFIK
ncbi:MAG: T9SS type A sorting domain-containing protein [Candidatus Marinimicrobia bacterium]|nr:T9SS type A sorting domain-containing protein [Candidatus Neomarinimicrobiota bacterium]MBT6758969.1 T9SS type A sorting domain-containing protein [Candidatus Neomarinimicrobiota bacterium]